MGGTSPVGTDTSKRLSCKESAYQCGDQTSIPESGRSPEEENGNPLQYLPGESQGHRSLVGYSPWGHKRVRHDLGTKQPEDIKSRKYH